MDGLVIVLFFLKGKLNRNYFKNWLEKVITGRTEGIITYFIYFNSAVGCSVQNTAAYSFFFFRAASCVGLAASGTGQSLPLGWVLESNSIAAF